MHQQQSDMTSRELIENWIVQNISAGKLNEELEGTLFVCGNEAHSLTQTSSGELEIKSKEVSQVVLFNSKDEAKPVNMCLACGQDYSSFKESIQCCSDID
jgi:hypothetical protein